VNVDGLITISDQYAGYNRGLPASPFIPAVLAALDIPSIAHSPETLAPKYGLTMLSVLNACGVQPAADLASAAKTLETNPSWVLLDQQVATPNLAKLNGLRDLMVKRPCLSTLECCIRPLHANTHDHLFTGYVHKPYPPIYAMCAEIAGFNSACFVKGVEGGVVPSVAQVSRYFPWARDANASGAITAFTDIDLTEVSIDPSALGIVHTERAVAWPDAASNDSSIAATQCATLGMAALQNESGVMRDAIRLGSAVALAGFSKTDLDYAIKAVDGVFESGKVWQCFNEQRKI